MTKIKCLICGDVLIGDGKGTFMQCKCENIYIDETEYYCRVGFKEKDKFKVLKDFKRKRVNLENEKESNRKKRRGCIKTNKD